MTVRPHHPMSDAAAVWITSILSGEHFLDLLNGDPVMQEHICRGGFKATARNLERPALRRRLAAAIARDPGLSERVLAHPRAPWRDATTALTAFDTAWLLRHWRELLRASGDGFLAAAMASDARPAIRERGLRLLSRSTPWQAGWQAQPQHLPSALEYFSHHTTPPEAVPHHEPGGEPGRLVALNHEMTSVREALGRQREKVKILEQELRERQAGTDEHERDLRRELRDARNEAATARAELPTQVAARIADFRRQVLDISQPGDDEMGDALTAGGDVLGRIERTLAAQEQLNASFGTREALRRRIGLLCDGAQKLAVCIEESVRLHPEVRRLHAAVCREIDHLREILHEDVDESHTPELAAQISAMIKGTSVSDYGLVELGEIRRFLDERLVADLLGPAALARLGSAIDQRRRVMLELVHSMPDSPQAKRPQLPREVWDIAGELQRLPEASVGVFIDGYNVTKRVAPLMRIEERDGLARSRDVFCDLCRTQARRFGHLEVVFDGAGALSARENHDGMTLVFSNGLGESQNADDYLVGRLSTDPGPRPTRWLVTDDTGLRHRAQAHCGAVVGAEDWYRFVDGGGTLEALPKA